MPKSNRSYSKVFFFFELLVLLAASINIQAVHALQQLAANTEDSDNASGNKKFLRNDPYEFTNQNTKIQQIIDPLIVIGGDCKGCNSQNEVTFHGCNKVEIQSCKTISDIVIGYSDCNVTMHENLACTETMIEAPKGQSITKVWVNSGCNNSGTGPYVGRYFGNPNNCETICCTFAPTSAPTISPTRFPTQSPSDTPTQSPTRFPTKYPTAYPTQNPTLHPTKNPTRRPTAYPTANPTHAPTLAPTNNPTRSPTRFPTANPTLNPTKNPTRKPTNKPTLSPTYFPTLSPTDAPTLAPTQNPTNSPTKSCPPQKGPKIDPCNTFGVTRDECLVRKAEFPADNCIFFEERRFWLNDAKGWNDPASPTFEMRKACPPTAINGAFASEVRNLLTDGTFTPWKFQPLGCQAEWDSAQIVHRTRCDERAQWNTWIIGNGDTGECITRDADNSKCYAAKRYDFCGLMSVDNCIIAIHCTWTGSTCIERLDIDSQLHAALNVVRKNGLYFQDHKQLAGPALGGDKSVLLLPEVGEYKNGFIRMFAIKGCNKEFDLQEAEGKINVQVRCGQTAFSTIGTVLTTQMDQAELNEFIFSAPNGKNCKTRLVYEGTGEVLVPSVRLGGFKL